MIALTVTATLRAQAHLGVKQSSGNFLFGLGYLPGRSLLGAAAWAWIDEGKDPADSAFAHRFLSGAVSWGDLLPLAEGASDGALPLPAPRTLRACKLHGLGHPLADALIAPSPGTCAACGAGLDRLDRIPGQLGHDAPLIYSAATRSWRAPSLRRGHRAHVSISTGTGGARPGALFSYENLYEGQRFRGQIHCATEELAGALLAELPGCELALGRGRSRGFGLLKLEVTQGDPRLPEPEQVLDRSKQITTAIAAGADRTREGGADDALYFCLTAASAWCLREPDGGHARALSPSRLAGALGIEAGQVSIERGDARSEPRSGWDGAAGLPVEPRQVLLPGSAYLCVARKTAADELCRRLRRLADEGLGEHRGEGLGRVVVNHPLHFPDDVPGGEDKA